MSNFHARTLAHLPGPAALQVRGLHKHFDGVAAVDGADLSVERGELHALIGPNGAGKSTFVNLLAGALTPDSGAVFLDDLDISALAMHQRVAHGLARSYQITNLFGELPARENIALALQARHGSAFNAWSERVDAQLYAQAEALLAQVDLKASHLPAARLAHGDQRKLEVALALATGARALLLDEPLAGMGEEESHAMIDLIARLKGGISVLLIEHDMDAVFRLADRISVLVAGKVIASGDAAAIRGDAQVRAAYLGDEA